MRYMVPFFILTAAAFAGEATLWTSAQLKDHLKSLKAKMSAQKVATENLVKQSSHTVMAVYRAGDGEAEVHEKMTDIFVVQTGEAVMVTGGEVVGAKSTGPGEIRGASIKGGTKHKLSPGDILHIPAGTPHQTLVRAGVEFTALIIKAESK